MRASRSRGAAGALTFAVIAAAGCLAADPDECSRGCAPAAAATPLPTTEAPASTPSDPPPIVEPGSARTWHLAGCRGGSAATEAVRDAVDALVPDAFQLVGLTARTATVSFEWLTCERIDGTDWTTADATLGRFLVRVRPLNDSWGPGASYWVFDFYVDNATALTRDLRSLGVHAEDAPSRQVSTRSDPSNGSVEEWAWSATDAQVGVDYLRLDGMPSGDDSSVYLWTHQGEGFLRTEAQRSRSYANPPTQDAVVSFTGSCALCAAEPRGDLRPWTAQLYESGGEAWVQQELFPAAVAQA